MCDVKNTPVNGSLSRKEAALSSDLLSWELVSTEHVINDEWLDLRRSEYRFPDGSTYAPYYTYSRRNYVVVVASDEEGNYLCVKQYRPGIGKVTTEFPAGAIEKSEAPLDAAVRELLEETGYESDSWELLLRVPSDATICDNYAHLFLARNCRRCSSQSLDEMEFLNVLKLSAEDIEKLIATGSFEQAVHIAAWYLAVKRT